MRERARRCPHGPAPSWPRSPPTSRPPPAAAEAGAPARPGAPPAAGQGGRPVWHLPGLRGRCRVGRPSISRSGPPGPGPPGSPGAPGLGGALSWPFTPGIAAVLHQGCSGWPNRRSSGAPAGSRRPRRARRPGARSRTARAAPGTTRFPRAPAPTRPAPTCGLTAHGRVGRIPPGGVRGRGAGYGRYRTPCNRPPSPFSLVRSYVCRFGNLAPLCRHHHRCKQAEGWQLDQPEPGVLIWRTPSGRRYTTAPSEHPV